jgi:hypothetical protein
VSTFLLVATGLVTAPDVAAEDSCFPDFVSLDAFESLSRGMPRTFSHRLRSKNVAGIYETKATLEGDFDGTALRLHVEHKFDGVSLPYVLFAALVTEGEQNVALWQDFTRGCRDLPPPVFPKQHIELKPPVLSKSTHQRIHIVIWGRL